MAMSDAKINQKLNQAHLDNQNRIRNLNREHELRIKNSETQKHEAVAQREKAHNETKEGIVKAYETRIRDNGERFQMAMARSNVERNKALQEQKEFYESQIVKQKQDFQNQLDNIQKDFSNTTKLNKIKLNNFVERQHEEDRKEVVTHNKEKQKISEHYKHQIKKLQTEHQKEVFALKRQNKLTSQS